MAACIVCSAPGADYVAACCVGPFYESGCGADICVCAECAQKEYADDPATVAACKAATDAFYANHEAHIAALTPPPREGR